MPIKANQLSQEVKVLDATTTPPTPGSEQGVFYPKKFGDIVDACFKNNQGAEIRLTVNGVPAGESNTASNVGSGFGLFKSKVNADFKFKSLIAGEGIVLSAYDADTVQIACSVTAGEVNDGENIGTSGLGIFKEKDAVTKKLKFKKLVAGENIDITEANDMLTIRVSNLAQNIYTGSNVGTGEGSVFKEISNNDFKFKRLKAGANTTITDSGTEITISAAGGTGTGEANTASNSAAGTGVGLFKQKVGVDLVFKKLKAGAGLSLTSYDDDVEINLSGGIGEANTASNATAGTGTGLIFKGKVGVDLVMRKLKAGTGITITTGTDDITIDSAAGTGEANTASNLGTGADGVGLFTSKNGVDLPFKRIKAGSNVSITSETNNILISAVGDINSMTNQGTGAGQVYKAKVGNTLQLKTLKAGSNVSITNGTDEITISSTGGTGSSISTYLASSVPGDEVQVTATDAGITYSRTGDVGTFTIPPGVRMLSFVIRVPGSAITTSRFVIEHNQGTDSQALGYPPIIQIYNDTASSQAWRSTAMHNATDTGNNSGSFLKSLITGLTNGSGVRIRGVF